MKVIIKNRDNQDISLIYNFAPNSKGLVFIQHGWGGFKEQPHIKAMAEVFQEHNISTVAFDSGNSFGESYGDVEEVTLKSLKEDLEDVIAWAESKEWYKEPFYLAGHSIGSASIMSYLFNNPDKVKAIAPTSAVLEGKLYAEAKGAAVMKEWERQGYILKKRRRDGEQTYKMSYQYFEYIRDIDFITGAENFINIPLLALVGEFDKTTPAAHQKILFDRWGSENKVYHVIKECGHTFKQPAHLKELKDIFSQWLKSID